MNNIKRSDLDRLKDIVSDIKELNLEASLIIESDRKLYDIVEKDTDGKFLSICCMCDETDWAIERYERECGF